MTTPSAPPARDGAASERLALLADTPLIALPRVGQQGAAALSEMGISSVLDLLMNYPRRVADRTNSAEIAALRPGEEATVRATVRRVDVRRPRGRKPIVQLTVADDSGELGITFFNQPWRARQLRADMEVVVFGKAETFRSRLQMSNPRVDIVGGRDGFRETGRIVPIYAQSEKAGVMSYQVARDVERALEFADEHDAFTDPLSAERLSRLGLISRARAFHAIHHPESDEEREAARRRLAFDELWRLQVVLVMRKRAALEAARGIQHVITPSEGIGLVAQFIAALPFALTTAQRRVIEEISVDLESPNPMHRLLQGDVGAGKTVVALATLLYGVQGGYQGAFMVPTEVLAEQHYLSSATLLSGLEVDDASRLGGRRPVEVALLTSKTTATERARIRDGLSSGAIDLLIGTHALLTEDVRFSSLGVVVIDEQHRFGVDQRAALREKGSASADLDADLLVVTATPIPRTAAMTVYGDLDYSVLDTLPVGRSPIVTVRLDPRESEDPAWDRVRDAVAKGNAAYVICPLVRPGGEREEGDDEDELSDEVVDLDGASDGQLFAERAQKPAPVTRRVLHAATEEYERLSSGELSGLRVGLLHGQLTSKQKEAVMAKLRGGKIDVLVATTVIEVGVDVPRATVMVIFDADRFGIAQLHQLRGRVGRGAEPSWCYLLSPEASAPAEARLAAIVSSTDGFELAEADLRLRGEGTVLGVRQKGRNDLHLASLQDDRDLVDRARELAYEVVEADPHLARHPRFAEELRLFVGDTEAAYLLRS